jgi:microcystin-dependent protein
MSLETALYIHQLNSGNPSGADRLKEGDDHIRLIKSALKNTFPGLAGPLDAAVTHTFLNGLKDQIVPVGAITLYYGAEAPTGWAICNGQTVQRSDNSGTIKTPDMRGRVPIGVSDTHALLQPYGQASRTITTEVGGAHSHTATTAAGGEHTHTVTGTTGSATTGLQVTETQRGGLAQGGTGNALSDVATNDPGHSHGINATATTGGSHTHTLTTAEQPGHTHAATIDVTQPSIALNYIMKV